VGLDMPSCFARNSKSYWPNYKMNAVNIRKPYKFVLAAIATLTTTPLIAQVQDNVELEEIVVTGSRIARDPNLGGPLPVQSLSSDDILAAGEYSLTESLNDLPALLNSTSSETSVDSAFADGANILNLRGLGSGRTLVLINGRRHVGGLQGTSAVDIGLTTPRKQPEAIASVELNPEGLPPEAILSPGRHKYIIVKAIDPSTGDIYKWFVKSASPQECGGPYHKDVARDLVEWIEACGYRAVVTGGGRILHNAEKKRALVYGFSYGFGRGDHALAAKVIVALPWSFPCCGW